MEQKQKTQTEGTYSKFILDSFYLVSASLKLRSHTNHPDIGIGVWLSVFNVNIHICIDVCVNVYIQVIALLLAYPPSNTLEIIFLHR